MTTHRHLAAILFAVAFTLTTSTFGSVSPTVRCVPNTTVSATCQNGYATIGAAVSASTPGDVIIVGPGTYAELVSIPTALTGLSLLGAQAGVDPRLGTRTNPAAESVIDASSLSDSALIVQATNVVIDGFTVQGGIAGAANGIDLKGNGSGFTPANGAQVLNNILQNNSVGLALNGEGFGTVNDVVIQQNLFTNNNAGTPSQAGDGIFSSACQNVTISDNEFTGNKRLSIGINNATGVTISNNRADGEGRFVVFTGVSHSAVVRNAGYNLVNTGTLVATARASYILLGFNNSYVNVSNNTLVGGEAGSTIRGIQLGGYGPNPPNTNITVANNTITSMPLHGIVAEQGELTNSVITGNRISASGGDGIFIDISNNLNFVSRNVSAANGTADDVDSSIGSGTAGTADVWANNIGQKRTPFGIAWPERRGDINADGRGDVILQNTNGSVAAWMMTGAAITSGMVIGSPASSLKVVGTGDFNGDGTADLLLQDQTTGDVVEWLLNGFSITASPTLGSPGTNLRVVGTADVNGDGRSDVILQNQSNGDVVAWEMNGQAIIGTPTIGSPGTAYKVVATGDFNGDNTTDLLLQNSTTGDVAEWQINNGTLTSGAVIGSPGPSWHVMSTGDFNSDGKADVLLQNVSTGAVAVWLMNGMTITAGQLVATPAASWVVVGSSDLDGDQKDDIVLQSQSTRSVAVWLMNGGTVRQGAIIATPASGYAVVAGK